MIQNYYSSLSTVTQTTATHDWKATLGCWATARDEQREIADTETGSAIQHPSRFR